MVNDEMIYTNPNELEKMGEFNEKSENVEKSSKVKNANDLGHEKEKKVELPLMKIPR